MSAHTCQGQISQGWGRSYSCGNKAKVERDGKHYCGVHDPVAQAEKRAAKNATYEAQMARASAARKAAAAAADEMARKAAAHDGLVVINAQLLAALQLIADTDHVDAALDPQRAIRAARAAIASATGSAA